MIDAARVKILHHAQRRVVIIGTERGGFLTRPFLQEPRGNDRWEKAGTRFSNTTASGFHLLRGNQDFGILLLRERNRLLDRISWCGARPISAKASRKNAIRALLRMRPMCVAHLRFSIKNPHGRNGL